jgi:hypothetical protein
MHALLTLWQLSLGAAASPESAPAEACPAAADVEAVLRRRGDDEAVEALRRSDVTVQGQILRVILRDETGTVVGVRELEAPTDCAERVSLAAVLLSAWARTWNKTTLVPLPTPASTKPAATARQIEIGVAAGGTDDGDGRAVGVALLGGVQLREAWGVALALDTAGGRDVEVGPGVGRYAVSRLGAGPCFRGGDGAWFDVALLPQLTRLAVEGRGLMSARPSVLWGAAVTTRLRAGLRWGAWAPFAGLGVSRTLVRETLTLDDIRDGRTLSSWDVEVELGLSWLWRPSE